MTKKNSVAQDALDELDATPIATDVDKAYERAALERESAQYVRRTALDFAITFHKNNGGMHQANQVTATAQVFLDFIKGEGK